MKEENGIRLPIAKLERSAPYRAPGYLEECLRLGKVFTDGTIEFTAEQYQTIREKYRTGLGDLVHRVAMPIARAFKLDCVDPATNQLKPTSPCHQRRQRLNKIVL